MTYVIKRNDVILESQKYIKEIKGRLDALNRLLAIASIVC